jgi:hypothetical protein
MMMLMILVSLMLLAVVASQVAPCSDPGCAVNLGTAGDFAILTKTGVTNVPGSKITGDIGVSPIAFTAITGFGLSADSSNQFSTSSEVTGKIYAANYAVPTPAKMTTAIGDMEIAYTDGSTTS